MKTICFDLDGVLCSNTWGNYIEAKPYEEAIEKVNKLFDDGNTIIIFTSRYMSRNKESIEKVYQEGYEFTLSQLNSWGLKFHKLIMGKPSYDILVDDKHIFYSYDWIKQL